MRAAAKLISRSSKRSPQLSRQALECRNKFLRFFPGGFADETYVDWERGYKWAAHEKWQAQLGRDEHAALIRAKDYEEIAQRAVRIESRTNLLFSFEKMALRDAVRDRNGARLFADGLCEWLYGAASLQERFDEWGAGIAALPRRQTRVLTWPLLTVFGFIADPTTHIFLKPRVTRVAADAYGYDFGYTSRPNWDTYASLLGFAERVRKDTRDLHPKDMIDLQSFIWVLGSDEYD